MAFSAVAYIIIAACSHHYFGNTCDEDARCWQFQNMYSCHERYFGDIHTPAYKEALRLGHNIKVRH